MIEGLSFRCIGKYMTCNAAGGNIHHSGVWIDHITWNSSNDPLMCHGRGDKYTI